MFFGLQAIEDHPCCQMQEVVEAFFQNSIDETVFSVVLFPDWFRPTLDGATCTVDEEFERVHTLLHAVGMDEGGRRQIYEQLQLTNRIHDLCDGGLPIPNSVVNWKSALGKAINALMERLYGSLDLVVFRRGASKTKPTKELYSEFIELNKYVCPFCGIGKYKNTRGVRREDFDHYLHRSGYPLAAANMRNLVPSCGTCNQDYKGSKDILADGAAFYPYAETPEMSIDVTCNNFPSLTDFDDEGQWSVAVSLAVPDETAIPKMKAWDRVYGIVGRLENEIQEFCEEWMEDVIEECTAEIDQEAFVDFIRRAREKASNAVLRRMQSGQIIRRAFYDFALSNANHPFFESFRLARNAVFT